MAQEIVQNQEQAAVERLDYDKFDALVEERFRPASSERKERIAESVRTLAQQALGDASVISDDVYGTVDAMVQAIDAKLSEQMNAILHHPEFQALESAWRGLHYLVMKTPTDKNLRIEVLNISKEECRKMFREFRDAAWDQSPLFKKIYEEEFGMLGGHPFGAFTCDYYFDHSATDLAVMRGLAKIGAAAHAPFIAAAAPSLLDMQSWTQLSNPRDLGKMFEGQEYMAWRAFRESDDSRYMALAMPRFLGRTTYGEKSEPVDKFNFEEETGGAHDKHLWLNAAYAMGSRITEAFHDFGWTTRIRGVLTGGTVSELPTSSFPTDEGGIDQKCPTEIAIYDRREGELASVGLMPLLHRKNTDEATFIGAQTLHKPPVFGRNDKEATANAALGARLPYIFASSRFAHYLKCMVRDWVGGSATQDQLQLKLHNWVLQYVDGSPNTSAEDTKARLPLRDAKVEVFPDEESPGAYKANFMFVPHHQLERMDIAISMVSKLPASRG